MTESEHSARVLQYAPPGGSRSLRPPERFTALRLARVLLTCTSRESAHGEIARAIGYSGSQVRRFANEVLGEPLASFAKRLRLERAAGRLCSEAVPVAEIGSDAGYATGTAFSRAFRVWFGSTPSEYRALNSLSVCLLPGFLISLFSEEDLPNTVCIRLGDGSAICFMYDGPVLLGRRLPSGEIDLG